MLCEEVGDAIWVMRHGHGLEEQLPPFAERTAVYPLVPYDHTHSYTILSMQTQQSSMLLCFAISCPASLRSFRGRGPVRSTGAWSLWRGLFVLMSWEGEEVGAGG